MAQVVIEDTVVVLKAVTESGADGADGLGVPAGGAKGQFLTKNTATDNDTLWNDSMIHTVSNSTTDATLTELFLDGISTRLVIPTDKIWTFRVLVGGRRTDVAGNAAVFDFRGSLKNVGGTVTLPGIMKEILVKDDAGFDVNVTADDANNSIKISVTGAVGKAMSWKSTVLIQEI